MRDTLIAMCVAGRYLLSRKSHSAVTAIAIAGVCGVAVATMAIVCVLSVFNGFNQAVLGRDARITPTLSVAPAKGNLIAQADSLADKIASIPGVAVVSPVVEDEAVAFYNGAQLPVNILGVRPQAYRSITAIDSLTVMGKWAPQPQQIADMQVAAELDEQDISQIEQMAMQEYDEDELLSISELGDYDMAYDEPELPPSPILVSQGVATNLGLPLAHESSLMLFLPRRTAQATFTDPASSFMVDSLSVTGIVSSGQPDFDAATAILDIDVARRLLEYDTQANRIYVEIEGGVSVAAMKQTLQQALGANYTVSDREQAQSMHSRMAAIEKWITFAMLAFILIIASFNIISTLCMLIVEKRQNISTMLSFGASHRFVGKVFFWQSMCVCIIGSLAGILIGVVLCLLQSQFGFITIPNSGTEMLLQSYPVAVKVSDLAIVLLLSAAVAIGTSSVSAAFAARSNIVRQ